MNDPTSSAPAVRASVPNSLSESSTLHKLSLSSCSTATRKECSCPPGVDVSMRLPCFDVITLHLNAFYCPIDFICTYSAGGSKGPARPLGGVRGIPAFLSHPAARGGARERRPE